MRLSLILFLIRKLKKKNLKGGCHIPPMLEDALSPPLCISQEQTWNPDVSSFLHCVVPSEMMTINLLSLGGLQT